MSRICRNMGDSGKLRFYELDHESKMRSSKPTRTPLTVWLWSQEHAKKSSRKKRRPYNKAIVIHQKPAACRRCGGGAEKALESAACRRCGGGGRKGSTANQPQKRYHGEASPRRYGREHRRKHKGEVMRKTSRGPSTRRGNDKYPGWKVATPTAPLGEEVFRRKKQSRTNTTHKR